MANGEQVAGDEEVAGVRVFVHSAVLPVAPVVVGYPLACRSYDTPLLWLKAACGVM